MESSENQKIRVTVDSDLAALIPKYLERRQADVTEIMVEVKTGQFERIRTLGHQMKGSGAGYGFDTITDIGTKIENEASLKRADRLIDLAAQLNDYLKRLEVRFE